MIFSSLNIIFFEARTDSSLETMFRRTRGISDRISEKIFQKEIETLRVCVALNTIWSYCILINIKFR